MNCRDSQGCLGIAQGKGFRVCLAPRICGAKKGEGITHLALVLCLRMGGVLTSLSEVTSPQSCCDFTKSDIYGMLQVYLCFLFLPESDLDVIFFWEVAHFKCIDMK